MANRMCLWNLRSLGLRATVPINQKLFRHSHVTMEVRLAVKRIYTPHGAIRRNLHLISRNSGREAVRGYVLLRHVKPWNARNLKETADRSINQYLGSGLGLSAHRDRHGLRVSATPRPY